MFTDKDLIQIKAHGLTPQGVEKQMENFRRGFGFLPVDRAAVAGDGIRIFDKEQMDRFSDIYTERSRTARIVKFVPASGAATRMFKELFEFVNGGKRGKGIDPLLENIGRFAFWPELKKAVGDEQDPVKIVSAIVGKGLDYGSKPKALILFHKYADGSRTAAEEHLVEGALYAEAGGRVNIHFTVSPEHHAEFDALMERVLPRYEELYGVKFRIDYSVQKPGTDTIAVTPDNEPFREADGSLLFRPAGHGALIENLNEIDADLIFIKTVDNVAPDRLKADTVAYKKALAGLLVQLQEEAFALLETLDRVGADDDLNREIAGFLEEELSCRLPENYAQMTTEARSTLLRSLLDRPIRVCGMVRNEGEPGGGPFWVNEPGGAQSLQIAESSQIAPAQAELMKRATHFNPVDLVCGVKDYKGRKFDLLRYVDESTGFISSKSKDGRELKAQELPGLWNGAMARWNTLFVEVPISTFSPVKVVNDLLRPQHQ